MRRVKAPPPPDTWYYPAAKFCKYANDAVDEPSQLIFLTDPEEAIRYWERYGFKKLLEWAARGFPSPYVNFTNAWIYSPDPGKEINGDS